MVPDIAKSGHSFKGAMAYYLHDKREGGGPQPVTAERVAWTESRNMIAEGPHTATRIMIATASRADELKAAAGVKATGRKSNAHVYAYSLAWHPDEAGKLDKAEMLRAVDGSLKALGASEHQALIVCHRDQKHPHVHVILNRVHPENGRMLSTSNDRLKLSDWANDYERQRGLILTPKREEKRQLRERFAEAQQRKEYAAERKAEAAEQPTTDKTPAGMLRDLQGQMREIHRKQWADLSAENAKGRAAIYDTHRRAIGAAIEQGKAEAKPIWAQHFKQERAETRAFERCEATILGRVSNALDAARYQMATGKAAPDRGALSLTFQNVLDSQARRAAFDTYKQEGRAEVAQSVRQKTDAAISQIKADRAAALTAQRESYQAARAALIEKQDAERAKMREAWRQIGSDRIRAKDGRSSAGRASEPPRTPAPDNYRQRRRMERHARPVSQFDQEKRKPAPIVSRQPEAQPMKRPFEDARRPEPPKPAAPIKTEPQRLSVPVPQATPHGVPEPRPAKVHEVPKIDRAAEWAKTQAAKPSAPPAPARQQFQKAAPETPAPSLRDRWQQPAKPTPAPTTPAQEKPAPSLRDRWGQQAERDRAADRQRSANERAKDRDYDRDR